MQYAVVAVVVIACALYASWSLMPAAARRALAAALLALRWPGPVAERLRRAAFASGGCACDGCDAGSARPGTGRSGPEAAVHVVTFQRRPRS